MATKTATKTAAVKAASKVTPKVAPAPATPAAETVFGVSDVCDLIKVRTGREVKTRDMRILLRKLARDGRLDREIIAGNRARWEFEGPEDPRIDTIVEAFEAGELDADKKEKLDALKEKKAADRAAKKAADAAKAEGAVRAERNAAAAAEEDLEEDE